MITGRLGAGNYLLLMSGSVVAWSALVLVLCELLAAEGRIGLRELNFAFYALGVLLGVVLYLASARRLMDLNMPSWLAKLLAFPLFALIILPMLCFMSGPRWANDYGLPQPPSGFGKILAALLLFVLALGFSYAAMVTFLQTRLALS